MKRIALVLAVFAGAIFWASPAFAAATRYEAENAQCDGTIDANHAGFSGTGFCNAANAVGGFAQFTVNAASAGTATIGIRYANGTTANRPADISVNGTVVQAASAFNGTGAWTTWATKTLTANVNAGANTIRIAATTASGPANIDYLDFEVGSAPAPEGYQVENCLIPSGNGVVESNHSGFTGTGFVNLTNAVGSYVECTVTTVSGGSYLVTVRYANGTAANRPMSIAGTTVNFPSTGAWTTWSEATATMTLNAGSNVLRLASTTADGGPNLDRLTVAPGGPPPPPPPPNPMAAAPYEYFGWGSPPDPVAVMNATGIKWFTLAFILSDGTCNPAWDGSRPLLGGNDQNQINRIRANGGDVMVSIGGWSGRKLGEACSSASSLAGAYQKVINAYSLRVIDIDIENTEWNNATVRQRVIDALKIVKQNNAGIKTIITFGTEVSGPDATGRDMINRGAASGLNNDVWAVMPFDFEGSPGDMGDASISAVEGLKALVKNAYGYSDAQTYAHIGLSSMNGKTDVAGETVTVSDFQQILAYANSKHIARFAFWSLNRDRSCGSGSDPDACSGISQQPYDFAKIVAQYRG